MVNIAASSNPATARVSLRTAQSRPPPQLSSNLAREPSTAPLRAVEHIAQPLADPLAQLGRSGSGKVTTRISDTRRFVRIEQQRVYRPEMVQVLPVPALASISVWPASGVV